MIWIFRRLARRPGVALAASVLIAGVTLVVSVENLGKPLGWDLVLTLLVGGVCSGMGVAKAKREWHDAWVRQTFTDVVIKAPYQESDRAAVVSAPAEKSATISVSAADHVLRLPHDGPDSDVIMSLPHENDIARSGRSE